MKKRLIILTSYWVFAFMFVLIKPAYGYIDPATTTYIIQVAAAIVITLGVSLSIFLYRFQMIITNLRVSLHALLGRLRRKQSRTRAAADNPAGTDGDTAETVDAPTLAAMTEAEALAQGIIDYPIPVRDSYPGLGESTAVLGTKEEAAEEALADTASGRTQRGFVSRLKAFGHWLWDDKRSRKERWGPSAVIAAAVAMSYGIFNMTDSVITNQYELFFTFGEIIGPILVLGLLIFAIVMLVAMCFKGRVFDFMFCLALSLLVCGYIQNTFLNASLGPLLGESLGWSDLGVANVLTNTLIWLAISVLIFTLGLVQKQRIRQFFKRFALFVPALLIAIQIIALFSILPPVSEWSSRDSEETALFISAEDFYQVSSTKNIIIILVDMMDERFVDQFAEEFPEYFDSFDGFTRYTNNVSVYNMTFPSVIDLMTGDQLDINITPEEYTENAYSHRIFVDDIHDMGYSCNLYMEKPYAYSDEQQLIGRTDNLGESAILLNRVKAPIQLLRLSLLKSAPLALKFVFWLGPTLLSWPSIGIVASGEEPYWADDPALYARLVSDGLETVEQPHFIYYHLRGFHPPYVMDAEGQYHRDGVDIYEQVQGSFLFLKTYLEELKRLDLYEDATIIITGDHPQHVGQKPLEQAMRVGCFVKPSGAAGTPLQYSNAPVSIENIRATCVEAAGGDWSLWGRTYAEVGEDEILTRPYFFRFTYPDTNEHYIQEFRIVGDARDWDNWYLVSNTQQEDENWFR